MFVVLWGRDLANSCVCALGGQARLRASHSGDCGSSLQFGSLCMFAAGDVPAAWSRQHPDFTPETLFQLWENTGNRFLAAAALSPESTAGNLGVIQVLPPPQDNSGFQPRAVASFFELFVLVFKRAWVQHSRSKISFIIDNMLVFVAALFLSLVYFDEIVYTPPQPTEVRLWVLLLCKLWGCCLSPR